MARELNPVEGEDRGLEPVALLPHATRRHVALRHGEANRHGHANRGRDVLGAGTPIPLLGPALLLAEDVGPVAEVEGTRALRAFELVPGKREEVAVDCLDV